MKIKTLIQLLILTMLCLLAFSCTEYEKYHVKSWQGAFFIDDTTIGAVGWEYDVDVKTSGFDESDFYNVYQYFFKYYINSKTLERVETLQSDVVRNLSYDFLAYHYPVLYYSTYTDQIEIGIFNIETKENKLLRSKGEYTGGAEPLIVSSNGKYMAYWNLSSELGYYLYNTVDSLNVKLFKRERPIFINDSTNKILLLAPYSTQKWFLLYDIITGNIDTLFENTLGYIRYVANNKVSVYKKFNDDTLKYILNSDLLNSNVGSSLPLNIQTGYAVTLDVDLNTGYCVHKGNATDRNYYLTDYKSGTTEAILRYSKEDK